MRHLVILITALLCLFVIVPLAQADNDTKSLGSTTSGDRDPGTVVGTTWWEAQHLGSMGRMIDWGYSVSDGFYVHMGWMWLQTPVLMERYYAYNSFSETNGLNFLCQVQPPTWAGYVQTDVTDDNRAVLGGHLSPIGIGVETPTFYWDFAPGTCFFSPYQSTIADEVKWPKFRYQEVAGQDPIMHVLVVEDNNLEPPFVGHSLMYYQKIGTDNAGTWVGPTILDSVDVLGHDLDASNISGKVALSWIAYEEPVESASKNPDVYYRISNDHGISWQPTVNLTKNGTAPKKYEPFTDISVLINTNDDLCIGFTSTYIPIPVAGMGTSNKMVFWNENFGFDGSSGQGLIRTVTQLSYPQSFCDGGEWQLNGSKMSISECDDKMYYLYVQFNDPKVGVVDDCAFRQGKGAANGELYVSSSNNWGLTWEEPHNISNTRTPYCDPNEGVPCKSEHWPSMAPFGSDFVGDFSITDLVDPTGISPNDYYLDIQYVEDQDPGDFQLGEGTQWEDDIKWFRLNCYEPVPNPRPIIDPVMVGPMEWCKHCIPEIVSIEIENIGNSDLNYNIIIEEDDGPVGWLQVGGFSGHVSAGINNTEQFDVELNAGGVVCAPGTVVHLTGRLLVEHNGVSSPDTIPINVVVADTLAGIGPDVVFNVEELHFNDSTHAGTGRVCFEYTAMTSSTYTYMHLIVDLNGNGLLDSGEQIADNMQFVTDDLDRFGHCITFPMDSGYSGPVMVYFEFDTEPMAAATDPGSTDFPAESFFDVYYMLPFGQESIMTDPGPGSMGGDSPPVGIGTPSMPDIPQKWNECGPTSTANSLIWLAERDGWVNDLLGAVGRPQDGDFERSDDTDADNHSTDEDALIEELKDRMVPGWTEPFPGLDDNQLEEGKADFIDAHDLPIEVHGGNNDPQACGASMFDWIKAELEKGQDVEMLIFWLDENGNRDGGHWVTVTDISFKDDIVTIDVCDPDDGEGTSEKPVISHYTANKNTGKFTSDRAEAGWAVAESPPDETCCIPPIRGNIDYDPGDNIDISDLVFLVDYMFSGGTEPPCFEEADTDASGAIDISDLVGLVDYMFNGGPPPLPCP